MLADRTPSGTASFLRCAQFISVQLNAGWLPCSWRKVCSLAFPATLAAGQNLRRTARRRGKPVRKIAYALFLLASLLAATSSAQQVAVDIDRSKLTVRVFKSGLFGGLAHDHEIAAPVKSGSIDVRNQSVELHFDSRQMKVLDPDLQPDKRMEVQRTMLSNKVLDSDTYSDIHFVSRSVTRTGDNAYRVEGDLTVHGVTRPVAVPVSVAANTYRGSVKLRQTEFGITPVKLFGGTVKVKDEIEITFEVFPAAQPATAAMQRRQ